MRKLDTNMGVMVHDRIVEELAAIADQEMTSRAAIVRRFIADGLRRYRQQNDQEPVAA